MANIEISLGFSFKTGTYQSAHYINHDSGLSFRFTKEKLFHFLQYHVPNFCRYASGCRRYTFHKLCSFLVHLDKTSFLPFSVSVHPVR